MWNIRLMWITIWLCINLEHDNDRIWPVEFVLCSHLKVVKPLIDSYPYNSSYNVIVKGLSAKPLTNGGAMLRILFVWAFSGIWTIFPLFGWNRYVPEGNMTACGTDYITKDWVSRSYILAYSLACYYAPLFLIIYSYWFIVQVSARTFRLGQSTASNLFEYVLIGCRCSWKKYARTS